MAMANRRRSRSPPANRQRSGSSPPTASSLFFPPELIPEVAKRLTSLQDFFALRAACRAYRTLLPLTASNLASQAPLHLVAFDRTQSHALFRHPTLRRIHRFRLPRAALDGNGYVVTRFQPLGCRLAIYEIGGVGALRSNLRIVHLLTGESRLSCPPEHVSRVLLYGDLVLTWKHYGHTIQYCHLEATDWRVAEICPYCLQDLIYVNGTLYALVVTHLRVASDYRLAVVELSENKNSVELVFLGGHWHRPNTPDMHLAECCGELILVCTVAFRVYHVFKWKFEEAKWDSITSLGGCTLFLLQMIIFVGCLGPNHRGIRGDFIYAVGYNAQGVEWWEYSLNDCSSKTVDAIYPGGEACSAAWVFPSMC